MSPDRDLPGDRDRSDEAHLPHEAHLLALASLPMVGPARLARLVAMGPPARTWRRLVRAGRGEAASHRAIESVFPRPADLAATWAAAAATFDVAACWQRHRDAGVGLCARSAPAWPAEAFADESVPPELLLWRGDLDALAGARVAVVGTRSCTRYGLDLAHELGVELARSGVAVVSGLAAGIDAAVHRGVLDAGGAPPIAVVGSGPDVVYPRRNAGLWHQVVSDGLLVTEAPLGTRPEAWRFPQRNRIIAALGDVVVVVESHPRGGAVITARHAMARGRTVLAMPGSLRSPASQGCHDLIADGVGVCRGTDDVLLALGMSPGARRRATEDRSPPGPLEQQILDAVGWQPVTLDGVVGATGLTLAEVVMAVDDLVSSRWLSRTGGWIQRVGRSHMPR
jgi:DNA processing protein